MAFKQRSTGSPLEFKEMGSSPAKQKGMTGLTKEEKEMKKAKLSSDVKSFLTGKKKVVEEPESYGAGHKKVMTDGAKNRIHGAGNTGNWQPHQTRD